MTIKDKLMNVVFGGGGAAPMPMKMNRKQKRTQQSQLRKQAAAPNRRKFEKRGVNKGG